MTKEHVLLVWELIPEDTYFFLIPKTEENAELIGLAEQANSFIINVDDVDSKGKEAQNATESINEMLEKEDSKLKSYMLEKHGQLPEGKFITAVYTCGFYC